MISNNFECKRCSSTDFILLHPGRDRLHGITGKFTVDKCKNCGLIAVHPPLSLGQIEKYYPSDYVSYPIAIEDEKSWFRKFDRKVGVNKRCDAILKRVGSKRGRILDIGCATGIFLNRMKQRGWDCYGVEPSDFAADYAQKRFSLDVFHGYLDDSLFEDSFFDVITLWDVMEHTPDPLDTLRTISRILKPDGLLVITTPNANAWERSLFGKYWAGWDVPRHYHVFTINTIKDLLNQASFCIKEIISFTGGHGAFVISLQFVLSNKRLPTWVKKMILVIFRSIPCRMIAYPYFAIAGRLNRSSIMTVFARKINNQQEYIR